MEVLFVFLKWVASFAHVDEETGSKMDLQNLATVICPNILYSKLGVERDDQFLAIRCITQLLEQQDEFYVVPDDFMPILGDQEYFVNSFDMPRKDFMRKCETYYKLKASKDQRPRGLNMPPSSSAGTPLGTPGVGTPGEDSRLVPQRSDPQISRGRQPDALRPPQPIRDRQTGSLERGDQRPQPSQLDYGGTAKGFAQVPQSYMPPMSPRKTPSEAPWLMQQQQHIQQQQQLMQRNGQNPQQSGMPPRTHMQMQMQQVPPGAQMPSGPPTPTAARSGRPLSWMRNGEQPGINGQLSPVTTSPNGSYQRQ